MMCQIYAHNNNNNNETYYKPHALHSGAPSSSLLHKGVVVVEQFEHTNCDASSSLASFLAL
jgi:hypothetical protein